MYNSFFNTFILHKRFAVCPSEGLLRDTQQPIYSFNAPSATPAMMYLASMK